eukprot:c7550_g1_i1.p1 GENE.c7550_g1_i1~~c7550_g1_i1.p1  ORF type:complete len:300 (-),score=62.46 c7550_g1_i1:196-1014(-)
MGKYDAAIDAYTEAICLSPTTSIYYTNRALCFFKKEKYDSTIADCDHAIRLDLSNIKANYFKGKSHECLGDLPSALLFMEKALDICNMQQHKESVNFVNEIRQSLKETKKRRANIKLEQKLKHFASMESEMFEVLCSEFEALAKAVHADPALSDQEKESALVALQSRTDDRKTRWTQFFQTVSPTQGNSLDVPDFLCCKISMDICADPCVTPSGITYDRGAIENHLRRGNQFDPVTRTRLTLDQLYPNIGIKQAIDCYYETNPWADNLDFPG